jgi:hypothetical protein
MEGVVVRLTPLSSHFVQDSRQSAISQGLIEKISCDILPTSRVKVHDDETLADKILRASANLVEEAAGHFNCPIIFCLRASIVDVGRTYRFLVGAGLRAVAGPTLIAVVFSRLETKPVSLLPHIQACMI